MKMLAISQKVLMELFRDKRTLLLLFVAPILIMSLMNAAFSADTVTSICIATVSVPDELAQSMSDLEKVSIQAYKVEKEAQQALQNEKVDAILIYSEPGDYAVTYANTDPSKTNMTRQVIKTSIKQAQFQELMDGLKFSQRNRLLTSEATQHQTITGQDKQQAEQTDKIVTPESDIELSESYIYGSNDSNFFTKMMPILMSFFVFFFVFLISGMALLKERTSGTLDRLLATPVKRSEIVFGYMLPYSLLATLQTVVIVLSTIWLFDLEIKGSLGDVILVNILFALVALYFGLLLSTLTNSEFQMMQFIPLIIIPQFFFSGIISLDSMAGWLQNLGKFIPLHYAGHALSKIVLNGTSILNLGSDLLILFLFLIGLTILNIIGLKRYRKV